MSRSAWCARIALTVGLFTMPVPNGADAQSAASISGVVKDTEGAVMPGVSVVIKNDASGASHEVTTDGERDSCAPSRTRHTLPPQAPDWMPSLRQ